MPPHLTVFSWALKMILKFCEDEDDDGDSDDEDGLIPRQQRSLESGRRQTFPFLSYLL